MTKPGRVVKVGIEISDYELGAISWLYSMGNDRINQTDLHHCKEFIDRLRKAYDAAGKRKRK